MPAECCLTIGSYTRSTPKGHDTFKLGDRPTYVTGDAASTKAILIVADVFGWSLKNTRVLADRYAKDVGARVYLPDFFDGEDLTVQAEKGGPGFQPDLGAFLAKYHPRDAAWPRAEAAVDAIRKAQPSVKKIGTIGFCWGAPSVLYLGASSKVNAIAFAHPSLTELGDFEKIIQPALFQCAETDPRFTDDERNAAIEVAKKRARQGHFAKFSYYPFTSHGWTIKGDESDPYTARAMAHAAAESVAFFATELSSDA